MSDLCHVDGLLLEIPDTLEDAESGLSGMWDASYRKRWSRASSGKLRRLVHSRDNAICQLCGFDCSIFGAGGYAEDSRLHEWMRGQGVEPAYGTRASGSQIEEFVWPRSPRSHRRTGWDADHIVPVHDGGLDVAENLRALCLLCHRRETYRFKAELNRRRRAAVLYSLTLRVRKCRGDFRVAAYPIVGLGPKRLRQIVEGRLPVPLHLKWRLS